MCTYSTVCICRIQMITDAHSENCPEHFPLWKTAQVQTLFIVLVMIRGTSDFSLFWRLTSHVNDHLKGTQHYKWRPSLCVIRFMLQQLTLIPFLTSNMSTYFPKRKLSSFKSSKVVFFFRSFLYKASGKGSLTTFKLDRESPHKIPKRKYLFFSNLGWEIK